MNVFVLACAAGGAVSFLGIAVFLVLRRGDKGFRRRLQRTAAPLTDRSTAGDKAIETDIFRSADGRSQSARLWRFVESRYPLLNARRTVPRAIAVGTGAAGGLWFSMWFLKIPSGWWTIPLVGIGGIAATWYAMSWFHARLATEFTRQFPEIIDQIVRLSGAGVPPLEAIAVVAEDARPPVQSVLRSVCDGLIAGLDADTALFTVSRRVRLAEFTLFTAVIRLQRRSGGGVSSAFSNLSIALRQRRSTAMKAHSSTAQTRLTLLVLSLMPVLVLVAQSFIAPQSVDILFGTDRGTTLLHWGVGLIVTGLLVARSIAARGER